MWQAKSEERGRYTARCLWICVCVIWIVRTLSSKIHELYWMTGKVRRSGSLHRKTFQGSQVDMLQHTATHCNTLQRTAAHCNTLQYTATHCNTLQYTATHRNTLHHTATHGNTLQHTAIHCSKLQHTATHCNTLQHTAKHYNTLQHTATCHTTLKHTAAHWNTLQHTTMRRNTKQHTTGCRRCIGCLKLRVSFCKRCRSLSAKEPLIIGLYCRKRFIKIRHPMGLRHTVH